jgi:hypothetical protein
MGTKDKVVGIGQLTAIVTYQINVLEEIIVL